MTDLTPMNADAQAAMVAFVHGEIRFDEFVHRMHHFIEVDFGAPSATIRYRRPLAARVTICPADLYPMLQSYLAGECDEEELGCWAQALDMMTEFGPPPDASDEEADRLEPLWDVLAHLGGAPIFGRATPESVRTHLARLRTLEAELAGRAT